MKLEDQVCSLELARKLKELGVKQESAFVWEEFHGQSRLFPSTAAAIRKLEVKR